MRPHREAGGSVVLEAASGGGGATSAVMEPIAPATEPDLLPEVTMDSTTVDTIRMPGPSTLLGGEDAPTESGASVFLKQNGQIYMVHDWATLEQWIRERRVDRRDLVSEGGVRWEPITDRPDLAALLDEALAQEDLEIDAPTVADVPFVTGQPAPRAASSGWSDDDTQGIPTGLPPLPIHGLQLHSIASTPDVETAVTAVTQVTPSAESGLADTPTVGIPEDDLEQQHALMAQVEMMGVTPAPADSGQWEDLLAEDAPPSNADPEPLATVSPVPPFSFDEAWDDMEAPAPADQGNMWFGAAALTAVILAVLLYALFGPPGWLAPAADGGPPADLVQADPTPDAVPPAPTPGPAPTTGAPVPVPPTPPPAPAVPAPVPVSEVIQQGWSRIDSDRAAAGASFKEALEREPDNDDANYGYGYVLLMKADPSAAKFLCKARDARDAEIRQDVVGLIASHSLSCP